MLAYQFKRASLFVTFFITFLVLVTTARHTDPIPSDPSTWTIPQLKHYLDTHGINQASLHIPERADYVHLVEENAAKAAAKKETIADWFAKHKDDAFNKLHITEEFTSRFLERVKQDLKARKAVADAEAEKVVAEVRKQVENVKDWGTIKGAQSQEIYDGIKTSLEKQALLKKNDLESVLSFIKNDLEATAADFSASGSLFASTVSATGTSAYGYVTSKAGEAYDSASSIANEAYSSAASVASGASTSVLDKASLITESAASGASSAASDASSAYTKATDAASDNIHGAYDTSSEYVDSVLGDIRSRLVSTKDWSEEQINGVLGYIKDSLVKARLTTERQVNSIVDGVSTYLVDKKEASQEQVNSVVKSVREELEKWRKNLPWVKKDEL